MQIMRLLRVDAARTVADVVGHAPVVIQGGSKVRHLKHIAHETNVPLSEMLFFDNERDNIVEVAKLGPTCVHCPRGMKDGVFRDGLALHLGSTRSGRRRNAGAGADGDGASSGRRGRAAARGAKSEAKRPSKDRRGGRGR